MTFFVSLGLGPKVLHRSSEYNVYGRIFDAFELVYKTHIRIKDIQEKLKTLLLKCENIDEINHLIELLAQEKAIFISRKVNYDKVLVKYIIPAFEEDKKANKDISEPQDKVERMSKAIHEMSYDIHNDINQLNSDIDEFKKKCRVPTPVPEEPKDKTPPPKTPTKPNSTEPDCQYNHGPKIVGLLQDIHQSLKVGTSAISIHLPFPDVIDTDDENSTAGRLTYTWRIQRSDKKEYLYKGSSKEPAYELLIEPGYTYQVTYEVKDGCNQVDSKTHMVTTGVDNKPHTSGQMLASFTAKPDTAFLENNKSASIWVDASTSKGPTGQPLDPKIKITWIVQNIDTKEQQIISQSSIRKNIVIKKQGKYNITLRLYDSETQEVKETRQEINIYPAIKAPIAQFSVTHQKLLRPNEEESPVTLDGSMSKSQNHSIPLRPLRGPLKYQWSIYNSTTHQDIKIPNSSAVVEGMLTPGEYKITLTVSETINGKEWTHTVGKDFTVEPLCKEKNTSLKLSDSLFLDIDIEAPKDPKAEICIPLSLVTGHINSFYERTFAKGYNTDKEKTYVSFVGLSPSYRDHDAVSVSSLSTPYSLAGKICLPARTLEVNVSHYGEILLSNDTCGVNAKGRAGVTVRKNGCSKTQVEQYYKLAKALQEYDSVLEYFIMGKIREFEKINTAFKRKTNQTVAELKEAATGFLSFLANSTQDLAEYAPHKIAACKMLEKLGNEPSEQQRTLCETWRIPSQARNQHSNANTERAIITAALKEYNEKEAQAQIEKLKEHYKAVKIVRDKIEAKMKALSTQMGDIKNCATGKDNPPTTPNRRAPESERYWKELSDPSMIDKILSAELDAY